MLTEPQIAAVIINFRTPDLLKRAVRSLRQYYPALHLFLIDNGSGDQSASMIRELQAQSSENTEIVLNDRNLHHGPAMDQALRFLGIPYVLFIDSDCEILRGGFLELMVGIIEEKAENYIVGKQVFMNKRGFDTKAGRRVFQYIRPICMLVRREAYLNLPPFRRHGTPCLSNMQAAVQNGWKLIDFPVEEYVHHEGRGTAGRFGYKLGLGGKINYLLNKLGL